MKKILDIKKNSSNSQINLRGDKKTELQPILKLKKKNTIYKTSTPIQEVKDIRGQANAKFFYLKGEKFSPPKYLGNIIKIAVTGLLILLIINSINVYYHTKKLEKEISAQAYEGYSYLIDAGKSATKIQFMNALTTFENARKNFEDAKNKLWFITADKTFYAKDSFLGQAVSSLLIAGEKFSLAGTYFIEAFEFFNKIPLYFVTKNAGENLPNPSITDVLKEGLDKTNLAIAEISLAVTEINKINEDILPSDIKARVIFAKNKINEISTLLQNTSEHFPAILKLLGDRYPHRYLILFQNNNEIRPTGGFIGSYAIVDINDGYIEKMEVHDSYDLDGNFGGIIEPPEEFLPFTGNWRFRDSNYSSDFPISAAKARWFLEKQGGPGVDTVIAINQGLLQDMLDITGPVQVGNFGALDSENYLLLLSYVIESKAWGAEDPKHILKVFVPAFKDAIMKEENLSSVMSKLYKAIQQKHIMMYSSDPDVQALFETFGLSGEVHESAENEDYLSVVNISINGTKSEQFVEENITHDTYVSKAGVITDEITLKRSHLWTDEIYNSWKKILSEYGFDEMSDEIIDILGRGENRVNTRIYVPDGSILLESDGEDVETKYDADLKKTYFLVRMSTKAGEASTVRIKYQLPFTLIFDPAVTYKLFVDKQPGSRGSIFTKTLSADPDLENLGVYPAESEIKTNGEIIYPTNLVYDKYFSAVFEK